MVSPIKLNQLRHFLSVVEAGTLRQASRRLFLSQSSVTKSIQQLEDALGAELLHRTSHGVVPTAAGKALISRAKTIESELKEVRNDIDNLRGAGTGEIKIVASPTVGLSLLPRTILSFKHTRPKVTVQIRESVYPDVLREIRVGDADFAICLVPERPEDEGLNYEILYRDTVTPAVRIGHALEHRRTRLSDLRNLEWVIYRRGSSGLDVFKQTFISSDLEPPSSTIECSSFACTISLVERGDFVTLVPKQLFSDRAIRWGITPLQMHTTMPSWHVAVIYRSTSELAPVCLAFLEELKSVASVGTPPR